MWTVAVPTTTFSDIDVRAHPGLFLTAAPVQFAAPLTAPGAATAGTAVRDVLSE